MELLDLSTVDVILVSNSASISALPFITEVSQVGKITSFIGFHFLFVSLVFVVEHTPCGIVD